MYQIEDMRSYTTRKRMSFLIAFASSAVPKRLAAAGLLCQSNPTYTHTHAHDDATTQVFASGVFAGTLDALLQAILGSYVRKVQAAAPTTVKRREGTREREREREREKNVNLNL